MAKPTAVKTELDQMVFESGFSPIRFWRSTLKPLSLLEGKQNEKPRDIASEFGDMFDLIMLPPPPPPGRALDFMRKQEVAGGGRVGVNLLANLLGVVGGKIGAEAAAKGAKQILLTFHETVIQQVSVDLLVKATQKAKLNEAVLERIKSYQLQRFVLNRCLKAGSILCRALDSKGGKVTLDLDFGSLPANGALHAGIEKNGDIILQSPKRELLTFGINYCPILFRGGTVVVGPQEPTNTIIEMKGSANLPSSIYVGRTEPSVIIGEQVKPVSEFLDV